MALRADGRSDEQAFTTAVAAIGPVSALVAEQAKNHSRFGRACAAVGRFDRRGSAGGRRGPLLAHSLLWAALLIATAMFLPKGTQRTESGMFLILVLVPTWWASEQILRRALRRER